MVVSSSYLISLCILLLIKSCTSSRPSWIHNKFYSSIEGKSLSRQEADNLGLMLNFIRESPEFRPLTFSVILPEFHSTFVDFLLRYISEHSIEAYTVRARDLSQKATWINHVRLTWIFIVRDLTSLNIFIYWQRELWKANNQYLIVFANEENALPWRSVFTNLWRKYNVYRAIILSPSDKFGCIMRYMPFEKLNNEFGTVNRLCFEKSINGNFNEHKSAENSLEDTNSKKLEEDFQLGTGSIKLFENFQNLNHYPIDIIVFESLLMNVSYDDTNTLKLGKPDANVVFSLQKALKAKFRIKAKRKIDFEGDPFAWSLTGIETGNIDIVITGFFVKVYDNFHKYQFTSSMYEDRLCFVSHDSGFVPKAYMPFLPFQKNLWALLMAYNVVITLLWYLVRYLNRSWRQEDDDLRLTTIHHLQVNAPVSTEDLINDSSEGIKNLVNNSSESCKNLINNSSGSGKNLVNNSSENSRNLMNNSFESTKNLINISSESCNNLINNSLNGSQNLFNKYFSQSELASNETAINRLQNGSRINNNSSRSSSSSNYQEPPRIPAYVTKIVNFAEDLCYPLQNGATPTQKALLFGILFFGLIVNGLYQSYLVSSLSKPFHYPQLHTVEDVLDSGRPIITRYANLKNVFMDDSQEAMELAERIAVIRSNRSTKDIVARENKISISRYYTMQLDDISYVDKEGNFLLYVVDECPMNYRLSYVLQLYSPYAERVNAILLRLKEAGFPNYWFESMMYPIRIARMKRKLDREKRKVMLSLDHYSLTFLLLFFGLFISTAMFCAEVYAAKRNKRR